MQCITRKNGRATRGLTLLILSIFALATTISACGSDESPASEAQITASTLQEAKAPSKQSTKPFREFEPVGSRTDFMDQWDFTETSAQATSLALNANIEFASDGSLELSSIPTFGIDGKAKTGATYTLRNPKFGREDNIRRLKAPSAKFNSTTIQYNYAEASLTAIYERRPEGIKQAFEVQEAPNGEGLLVLKYEMPTGFKHSLDASTQTIQIDAENKKRFQIRDLVVFDAESRRLPANIFIGDNHFGYTIDDRDAVYPLNIAPLIIDPNTAIEGENPNAEFGYIVSNAGDLNNDGFDDIAVGEINYSNGENKEGRIVVFLGSLSGVSATASIAIESDLTGAEMGSAIEAVGDINGDGFDDLAVGARYSNNFDGSIFVFEGQATATNSDPSLNTTPLFREDGVSGQQLGFSLASGDINCDGITDLVVGSRGTDSSKGSVQIYDGDGTNFTVPASWTTASTTNYANFGYDVAVGNLDGDTENCDDIVVAAPYWTGLFASNAGQIKVYLGNTGGPSTTEDWSFEGAQATSFHGISMTIDDFNGDGVDDLAFGANLFDSPTQNDVGRVYVYYGDAAGFPGDNAIINGFKANERFGSFLSSAGDINADGYADLLVGAFKHTDTLNEQGAAYLFPGTATGLLQAPSWTGKGDQAGSGFGRSVSGAGDVNGDGFDDFLVGAYLTDIDDGSGGTLTDAGQVFVYHGGPTCYADEEFFQDGEVNPDNSCQVCDTSGGSVDGWMNVDDALAQSCDDGNLCTENDVCVAGACVGTVKDCALDPAQTCTIGVCDPTDGSCTTEGLPATTQCEPAACVSETEAAAAGFCDGDATNGVCLVPTTVDCAPFKCNAGACRTTCNRDNQCAPGAWCDRDNDVCSTDNRVPTADAGPDQTATMGTIVTLDGSASSDPDNDTLTYAWTQLSGEAVTLDDATSATPQFTVPGSASSQDVLEFQLVVNDGDVDSAPATTNVLVTEAPNTAPTAEISGPTTAEAGDTITLSAANSSDPEGDNLIYTWSLVSGMPAPVLGDDSIEEFEITFPEDITVPTTYSFLLVVNDGRVNSAPDTHNVVVSPKEVGEDVGPGDDAGPDAGPDAGDDTVEEDTTTPDEDTTSEDDAGTENDLGGDLAGSGCACSSGADGAPLTPGMVFGAMALGGLALLRRRRWMN